MAWVRLGMGMGMGTRCRAPLRLCVNETKLRRCTKISSLRHGEAIGSRVEGSMRSFIVPHLHVVDARASVASKVRGWCHENFSSFVELNIQRGIPTHQSMSYLKIHLQKLKGFMFY